MNNEKNEFILFDGIIMNAGSILQVIPYADWEWKDENRKEKEEMFVIHFLGGGSLKFPMTKFDEIKKVLLK